MIHIDSLDNIPQFTWDTEAGTVTDHTVTPEVTRAITPEEMTRFTETVEPVGNTIADAKAAIESATTIAALRRAVVEALDILEQN